MRKRRNRICRRIAVALTVALLVGQSQALVLAEEDAGDVLQTEISSEGTETDQQGEGDGQDKCICGTKCAEDAVNTDCPVCAADSAACAGKADDEGNDDPGNDNTGDSDTENDNTENNNLENDGQDNTDSNPEENTDEPNRCVCETACAEDAVNADCPVCAADYVNCAKNAGGGVKLSVETAVPETASENMLDEEAGVAALAETDMEPRAVGGTLEYTYGGRNLKYTITKEDGDSKEVEVVGEEPDRAGYLLSIPIIIPESIQVEQDGTTTTYTVTGIGEGAFHNYVYTSSATIPDSVKSIGKNAFAGCEKLEEITIGSGVESIGELAFNLCKKLEKVTIPDSVKSIGRGAFNDCSSLTEITIGLGVESIGQVAFAGCSALTEVTIPDSVTSIADRAFSDCTGLTGVTISKNVKEIKEYTFSGCSSLTEVVIPNSVTTLERGVFHKCSSLGKVTLWENALPIADGMFYKCTSLTELNIAISSDKKADFCSTNMAAFDSCPVDRQVYFLSADGKQPLTGTDWQSAKQPYQNAPDGDTTDNLWYGWLLDEPPEAEDTHKVTITVQKDDSPWTDHNRTFALTKDSTTFVTDLDAVEAGTYTVYDVTGVAAGDFATKGMDTGVTVTVADTDASAIVEYYTVAFCYLDDDGNEQTYGDSTDWKPQTILKTVGRVAEPATNPTKADHAFDKWVTAPDGDDAFAFETTPITAKDTKIYAKWKENTVTTYHTVTFYDGDVPYGADTPQKPQSVADGQKADRPDDPEKAGWEFAGWKTKTADGGSTDYNFDTPVTGDTNIYASWVKKTVTDSLRIQATATEGGTIAPKGEVIVSKGGERTFTITPDEGYRIKSVTVDDGDVTADLKETRARAQTGARYYTFTNIVKDHTIHAEFERDGGENPNPNPTPGGDGGNTNPDGGSGGSGGGSSSSGGGDNGGGDTDPDGGNGAGNTVDFTSGENTGNTQATAGTEISSAQAGSNAAGVTTAGASGQTTGANGTAAGGKEPKTGDNAYWEVYATLAMVAGLTYLLLYIMEESRGMTEREKEAAMAALIRWGKKGGAFRKCCAMAAIFGLLLYYHAIGKRAGGRVLRDRYPGQAF